MSRKFKVLSEVDTLELALTRSIARVGDGEFRLARGAPSASQSPDPRLQREMVDLLAGPTSSLVCLPNLRAGSPKMWFWNKYDNATYEGLCRQKLYGSTWITRPDDAPWIDRPEYWDRVAGLWTGRDVVLVTGDHKSLTEDQLTEAKSVRVVMSTRQHAYAHISEIQEKVGQHQGTVLICLGATATVLAERFAKKDIHALDLGHIGMFMRRRKKLLTDVDQVTTSEYRELLRQLHSTKSWGNAGKHHAETVVQFAGELSAKTVLDYGCGTGSMATVIAGRLPVSEYDPGIVGKDTMPLPADLVVATDVLEHIEPDMLNQVLKHIRTLAGLGAYFIISCKKAKETLADGRNAHLIVQRPEWWLARLKEHNFTVLRSKVDHGFHVWAKS